MPMMTAPPAFPGSALWFLGEPTAAGMHAGTLAFTAGDEGPGGRIPEHARGARSGS